MHHRRCGHGRSNITPPAHCLYCWRFRPISMIMAPAQRRSRKDGHLMSQIHNYSAPDTAQPWPPVEVFYSYSHKDEEFLEKLITHLSLLKRNGAIAGWHDRQISAGTEWKNR